MLRCWCDESGTRKPGVVRCRNHFAALWRMWLQAAAAELVQDMFLVTFIDDSGPGLHGMWLAFLSGTPIAGSVPDVFGWV